MVVVGVVVEKVAAAMLTAVIIVALVLLQLLLKDIRHSSLILDSCVDHQIQVSKHLLSKLPASTGYALVHDY